MKYRHFFMSLGLLLSLGLASVAFAAPSNTMPHDKPMHQERMEKHRTNTPMQENMGNHMRDGAMTNGMMSSTGHMMGQKQDYSDKAFLSAMIPHHEAAIDMALDVLKNGKDPQVKKWAESVISNQKLEISMMTKWLNAMGGVDNNAAADMKSSMHAMMTAPVSSDADINFVDMMIGHHAGAVEMAVDAIVTSTDDNILKLSNAIVRTQLDEIMAYKAWLKNKGQ